MGFEIDYLPVGKSENEKSGDAIAMRFWETTPESCVVITVDGGTRESGAALVQHIKTYYKTTNVRLAVLTHPDADHASGLRDVLEQLQVGCLLTIVPWLHAEEIWEKVKAADGRITVESIKTRLREAFPAAVEAVDYAEKHGVAVVEPFAYTTPLSLGHGTTVCFLGPSRNYYINELLPRYICLPQAPVKAGALLEQVVAMAAKGVRWVKEKWDEELLVDPGADEVSSENNSSVVMWAQHGDQRFLFCGDAGVPALSLALTSCSALGLSSRPSFFHVPHHGSRHNLGPSLLNSMFGPPKGDPNCDKTALAFVSATKDDAKHPSRRITNALYRRGVTVIPTWGGTRNFPSPDAPSRGWPAAQAIPFHDDVEEVDGD